MRGFLKQTYPLELELPTISPREHISLEYQFFKGFETNIASTNASDIDGYLDTPLITFKLNKSNNQAQYVLNQQDRNRYKYPCIQ